MLIEFSKMHGLGNDFVVIDLIRQRAYLDTITIQRMADRHFGLGFDQLLIVEPPEDPSADFKYRIFNADGSEVEQCGNGVRCFARFVYEQQLTYKTKLRVETKAGIIEPELGANGWVRVNMGQPKFAPEQIPFDVDEVKDSYSLQLASQQIEIDVVNMGNPHAVYLVDDVLQADVARIGAEVESHVRFPERVNVGFLQVISRSTARLRVYERGVGETLACGTGACAAVVSGIRRGLLDAQVEIELAGGVLSIAWQEGEAVWMTGPTAKVYDGRFDLRYFQN